MDNAEIKKLRSLTSFDALVDYLRDELDWPIEAEDAEDVAFDYSAAELGIDPTHAVKIKSIKQVRPLEDGQPWGIFYVEFESKRLPVVVLRRILQALVPASRRRDPNRPAWQMSDLLFISSQGEPSKRSISFAHFRETDEGKPELRTFSWDSRESHLYYIKNLNLEALRWPARGVDSAHWRSQWSQAFTVPHRYVPTTAQMLAEQMASLAADIRDTVLDIYEVEHTGGPLHQLHLSFRLTLINDLEPKDFADMYAQTVTYGLFSARATRQGEFAIQDVAAMIPNTNPFLRELLEQLTHQDSVDLDELGVEQLARLLRDVDMEAILRDFGRQKRGEDPVIHFYETFLGAYDAEKKAQRGVFYTPKPAVSYIVRSVHELLQTEFGLEDGLADTVTWGEMAKRNISIQIPKGISPDSHFVVILDPATGTATFPVEVIDVIYDTMSTKWRKQGFSALQIQSAWNDYVPSHLLPRLYGYELMMAPYAIAHMKIGLKLYETGYRFASNQRANIYLTNALEEPSQLAQKSAANMFDALGHEAQAVNDVKRNIVFTVVIGNPPYSVISGNLSKTTRNLIDLYRFIDGEKITERSMLRLEMHLQDDYVKFFALFQKAIRTSGTGVIGIITNNGFLDNLTLRGVRFALQDQFDLLAILNLHGSHMRKRKGEELSADQNVFDIEQGVTITLGKAKDSSDGKVVYSELLGDREFKYNFLAKKSYNATEFFSLTPQSPNYFFVPRDDRLLPEYKKYILLTDAMPENISGIVTAHDSLVIDFDDSPILKRVQQLVDTSVSDGDVKEVLNIRDNAGWKVSKARIEVRKITNTLEVMKDYSYRPFDVRRIFYHPSLVWSDRRRTMSHVLAGENLALATCRQLAQLPWEHVFITRYLQDDSLVSNRTRERSYHFPLYLKGEKKSNKSQAVPQLTLLHVDEPPLNFSRDFLISLANKLGLELKIGQQLPKRLTAEDIFHYIYSIFYSPSYRERYAEFLKIDFPRLPLTSNVELFRALSGLGADLVAVHLLEDDYEAASWVKAGEPSPLQSPITTFVEGANGTTMGSFSKSRVYQDGRVYLDTSLGEASSYFDGIPGDVWNFHIGGYQVLYKWLYDRRGSGGQSGRTLTAEDIEHYQRVVVSLKETIRLMGEVDEVIESHGGWPVE